MTKYTLTQAAKEVLTSIGIQPSMIDTRAYKKLIDQSPVWAHKIFESAVKKVRPDYADKAYDPEEDFTDPELILKLDSVAENVRKSDNALELIELIRGSIISREIKRIIYHCTATSQDATVAAIKNYWKNNLGWSNPGYHIIVDVDGKWTLLQDFNKPTNGVRGKNKDSIHISFIGGIDSTGDALDNRTEGQKEIFKVCYEELDKKLNVTHHGHNEFSSKACPSYNVKSWIESIKYGNNR